MPIISKAFQIQIPINKAEFDHPNGLIWLKKLLTIYKKYQGTTPVTPEGLLCHFKHSFDEMEEHDKEEVCDMIETKFGNEDCSYTYISGLFRHWVNQYYATFTDDCKEDILL